MFSTDTTTGTSFLQTKKDFEKVLKRVFYKENNIEKLVQKRLFPKEIIAQIMAVNPLSVAIPENYGGQGCRPKECLSIMETASYESLPLSLIMGINMALFLQPVAKYANKNVKEKIFNRFLHEQNMGGLMITEPDYGSDAMNMQTFNEKIGKHYHISGTKHWQGLTGMADYWIMTARAKEANGNLKRDLDFFICDTHHPEQMIKVEEYYNNVGLYPIPYGKNLVDIKVPEENKMEPESTGLKLMMDLLHRSRLQFPGMGMGYIRRIMEEAIKHTRQRFVGGKSLLSLDQVQLLISRIQSAFTVCSAMCHRSSKISGIEHNLSLAGVEANSVKAYLTDLMQECAQILTQLQGANGYKTESLGARGIIDSRPFQIFEGSNDMLYTQISDTILKTMARMREVNLFKFLTSYDLTKEAADIFKSILNVNIEQNICQRKRVDLGRIISKVTSAGYVLALSKDGFSKELVSNSLKTIQHEVSMVLNSFQQHMDVGVIEDYNNNAAWLKYT